MSPCLVDRGSLFVWPINFDLSILGYLPILALILSVSQATTHPFKLGIPSVSNMIGTYAKRTYKILVRIQTHDVVN